MAAAILMGGTMGKFLQEEINTNVPVDNTPYPETSTPDPLGQAAADHEAYAASRRGLYFGREEYALELQAHIDGNTPPLAITGDPGSGKTALLANWIHFWSQRNPDVPLISHYIGAAPDTAGWAAMLSRLLGEFRRIFELPIDIPDDPFALRVAFANALHRVAARGRAILILDGLDQLEDRESALDLAWMPPVIPANIRLIVSTNGGRPWADLRKRAWPVLQVKPLTKDEREALIRDWLARYEKTVSAKVAQRIAAARPAANPLYLTTLLNELRSFGRAEELDRIEGFEERLAWYLEAPHSQALFNKAMQRWEFDCAARGTASEDLSGEVLTRIWAARRGLSEEELVTSLGTPESPVPYDLWWPLQATLGPLLVSRGGLLTFAHPMLRQAVGDAYLPTPEDRNGAHLALATFFYGQPKGPRQFEELPWQWEQAGEWKSLAFLLAQPGFFAALWNKNQTTVKKLWKAIEANSSQRMETVYAAAIRKLTTEPLHAARIGDLLWAMDRTQAAQRIRSGLVKHLRQSNDRVALQAALGAYAAVLQARDDVQGALAHYHEQEVICRALIKDSAGNSGPGGVDSKAELRTFQAGLQSALAGQAALLYIQGELDRAMPLYKEQEKLCRELSNDKGLAGALAGQAGVLYTQGDHKGGLAILQDCERTCREQGDKYGQATSFGSQALILMEHGDLNGALTMLSNQERVYRELGHMAGIANSLGNQATIVANRGDFNGAMARYKEQERICREIDLPEGLAVSIINQAVLLINENRSGEARLLADLAFTIATRNNLQSILPGIQGIRDSIAPVK